jgi:hypothetical protein
MRKQGWLFHHILRKGKEKDILFVCEAGRTNKIWWEEVKRRFLDTFSDRRKGAL